MERIWLNYKTTPEEVARMNEVLTRDAYRRFKQVDRRDMAVVLARIYHFGFEDGAARAAEAVRDRLVEEDEVRFDWEVIMETVRGVSGIGKTLADRINSAVIGKFSPEE